MSAYENFVYDFPNRCRQVLENYGTVAKSDGLEITLLLSVASASFIVPFERLKVWHPSGDSRRFPDAGHGLSVVTNETFLGSQLHEAQDAGSWQYAPSIDPNDSPDSWLSVRSAGPMPAYLKVWPVLHLLRNALAHGNLCTLGRVEVKRLVFASSKVGDERGDFHCVACSPEDFRAFLLAWLEFLKNTRISRKWVFE